MNLFFKQIKHSILHFCSFNLYKILLINRQNSVIVNCHKITFDLNTNIIMVINLVSVYTKAQDTSIVSCESDTRFCCQVVGWSRNLPTVPVKATGAGDITRNPF